MDDRSPTHDNNNIDNIRFRKSNLRGPSLPRTTTALPDRRGVGVGGDYSRSTATLPSPSSGDKSMSTKSVIFFNDKANQQRQQQQHSDYGDDDDEGPEEEDEVGDLGASSSFQRRHQRAPLHRPPKEKSEEKNCCLKLFLAIFSTRQLAGKNDRELYIKYLCMEFFIYAAYLAVICILTYGMTTATTFYFTRVMYDLFIVKPFDDQESSNPNSFKTSSDIIDFWDFQRDILKNLYWHEWSGVRRYVVDTDNDTKGLFYENQLLGAPRFRQIRVLPQPCPASYRTYPFVMEECYPDYSPDMEDTGNDNNSWATGLIPSDIQKAWLYQNESELNGSSHWGRLSTYSGAGAVKVLIKTKSATDQIMNSLKQNLWITSATRAVFLDFTVYNSNINLFCVVRLLWEFSPTGALATSWSLRTVRLIRYLTWYDNHVVFPCEIMFCIFTVYYLIQELLEMKCQGCKEYFTDIWAWLDLGILAVSGVCIGFSVHRYMLVESKLQSLSLDEAIYHDFEFLGYWQVQFNHAVSIVVFFAWIKIFKYISFNKTMTQLSSTLSRCAKDIGGFAIMFFIVFFAFAQLGYLLFGSQVEDFSTLADSIFTLLRLILGDFDYQQLEAANRVLGPIFFLVYVFFVFFVLLNMFLAIINDTYGEVKAEIQAQRNQFGIADYFKRGFYNLSSIFGGKRNAKFEAESLIKISDGDEEQITYDELRKNLLNANFSEVEVEMFLARYELDQDRALDEEETQQVLADLEGKKIVLDTFSERGNSGTAPLHDEEAIAQQEALYAEEFSDLTERVQIMESTMVHLHHKLDELLTRIEY